MQCQSNLKQLALGCHNYHEQHGHLPVGTVSESAESPDKRLAWTVRILPFIDQDYRYKKFDLRQGWDSQANLAAASQPLKTFLCPADHRQRTEPTTVYVGVAGAGVNAAQLPLKDKNAGAFGLTRKVRFEDVKDGISFTLLLIETTADSGRWSAGGLPTVRGIDEESSPLIAKQGAFGIVHSDTNWNFGRIPVTANAALADGSVRQVAATVAPETMQALATVAGGETVRADW